MKVSFQILTNARTAYIPRSYLSQSRVLKEYDGRWLAFSHLHSQSDYLGVDGTYINTVCYPIDPIYVNDVFIVDDKLQFLVVKEIHYEGSEKEQFHEQGII